MEYLLKTTEVYRVPTEEAALELRQSLDGNELGRLTSFKYTLKQIKAKGEVVEEYWVCTATIEFTKERDPDIKVIATYEEG